MADFSKSTKHAEVFLLTISEAIGQVMKLKCEGISVFVALSNSFKCFDRSGVYY